ncbi:MAG: hypothetical protein AAF600_05095 [Bacteroidota bacterium]
MKYLHTAVLIFLFLASRGQVFDNKNIQLVVKKGADHIYNSNKDSAFFYAKKVERLLPDHPVVPLMRAIALLWSNIPIITPELFTEMERQLDSTILLAKKTDPDLEDPEMIFFTMSAHGLLAEYYADQDQTMKAVGEASRAYGLLKKGFDLVDEYPEFLFSTGLYNYFIEMYPQKHPIYKPLLWFFRKGDRELGLQQLETAAEQSLITKVEAYVYLSYIYLRYEYKPEKAQAYLLGLCKMYPRNFYAKAKYLESLANPQDFRDAPIHMIYSMIRHENSYYKLAGYIFLAYFEEVIIKNQEKAEYAYRKGLKYGAEIPNHGEFFKGFGYLGLGRVLYQKSKKEETEEMLHLALKYSETKQITKEAKELLSKL